MDDKWKARFDRERSARKEAEALLVERARALEDAHARLSQLQTLTLQYEKSSETSQLFATIAHELNTPLGVALAASSLAVEEVRAHPAPDSVAKISKALELVTRNLLRSTELISRFKQLAVDRASPSNRRIDGREYLNDILEGLQPALRLHNVTLESQIDDLGHFDAAAGPLSQVITNLIMNAAHHAFGEAAGSGPRRVRFTGQLDGGAVLIEVEDNGVGMSEDTAARVFEPHFTTARDAGGSGLGLHIVYEFVTLLFRGTIDLDTAPGVGTRWTIRIPFDIVGSGLVRTH